MSDNTMKFEVDLTASGTGSKIKLNGELLKNCKATEIRCGVDQITEVSVTYTDAEVVGSAEIAPTP